MSEYQYHAMFMQTPIMAKQGYQIGEETIQVQVELFVFQISKGIHQPNIRSTNFSPHPFET